MSQRALENLIQTERQTITGGALGVHTRFGAPWGVDGVYLQLMGDIFPLPDGAFISLNDDDGNRIFIPGISAPDGDDILV